MSLFVAERTWVVENSHEQHSVHLTQGTLLGDLRVDVDDELILETSWNLSDMGSHYSFGLEGHAYVLGVVTNGIRFDYYLVVDGVPMLSAYDRERDRRHLRGRRRAVRRAVAEHTYWEDVAEITSLRSKPVPFVVRDRHYRLIGLKHDRFVMISYAQGQKKMLPLVSVLVRYTPLLTDEMLETRLTHHAALAEILGKRITHKDTLSVQDNHVGLTLRYEPKKETASHFAATINTFVDVVASYTQPLAVEACESPDCQAPDAQSVQLVLLNKFPVFLCQDCLDRLPAVAEEAKQAYLASPPRLLRGAMVGFVAAVVSGIGGSLIFAVSFSMGFYYSLIIPFIVIRVMLKFGTRLTIGSALIAAGLTVGSLGLSVYLFTLGRIYREYRRAAVTLEILHLAWRGTWEASSLLILPLFISVIGIALAIWEFSAKQKEALSKHFTPVVESVDLIPSSREPDSFFS